MLKFFMNLLEGKEGKEGKRYYLLFLTWLPKVAKGKGSLKVVEDARGCQSCDGSVVVVVKRV